MKISENDCAVCNYDRSENEECIKDQDAQKNFLEDRISYENIKLRDFALIKAYLNGNVDYLIEYQAACGDI